MSFYGIIYMERFRIDNFQTRGKRLKVKIINGLAGTGKTTHAINTYDARESIFLAFTRNAAQAFADKAGLSDESFKTIHSFVSPFSKKILTNGALRDNKAFNKYLRLIPTMLPNVQPADNALHEIWGYSLNPPEPIAIDYLHANRNKSDFVYNFEMILVYGLYSLREQSGNPLPPCVKNLIVDEYQDVSELQYQIIKELVRGGTVENLVFLGDANQRIFEFAIGEFTLSKAIREDFADVEEITLTKDYRHTKELLAYIDIFARDRCGRLAYKVPTSVKEAKGSVTFRRDIANAISQFLSDGLQCKDITVISRTNKSCYEVAKHIQEDLGYPVNAKFSVINCILQKLSEALATYIKAKTFDHFIKFIGLCRLTNVGFDRGIKARIKIGELTKNDEILLDRIREQLNEVVDLIESGEDSIKCLNQFKPLAVTLLFYANKDVDTAEFIATTTEELNGENISYTLVAEQLIQEYFSDIMSKTETVIVDIKNKKNGICVSTVHRYKGLENTAIIFCPEYKTNCLSYSLWNDDYESEENILYTAITRPLNSLCIVVNEQLGDLYPSLYKLFPTVADMAKCGLVNIADGNLSIPSTGLSWKDKIHGLDFNKYSLDRETSRDNLVLLLRKIDGENDIYRLEFTKIGSKTICFANPIKREAV